MLARGRGRPSKLNKRIAELYKEGKCRECTVRVTRMDFAKILGKFTKVKIQYEAAPRPSRVEKKITSPSGNARLRSNENGMVLIHRAAYKEHPVKEALPAATPVTPAPRKRGRPPKIRPPEVVTVTRYRIVFYERRDSLDSPAAPDGNIADLLAAISSDVLPTDEWFIDYLLQDEPKNDRVYDRIAAELEGLMCDAKTVPAKAETKSDEFPSIMELLDDSVAEPARVASEPAETTQNDVESILSDETESKTNKSEERSDVDKVSSETKEPEDKSQTDSADVTPTDVQIDISKKVPESEEAMKVENVKDDTDIKVGNIEIDADMKVDNVKDDADVKVENDADSAKDKTETQMDDNANVEKCEKMNENTCNSTSETPKVNGKVTGVGDQNVNVETINYVVFKRVKNDECTRLVKCSKNLNYTIEMDGRRVELLGAPKYISCVEDLRLMLQIVDESDLDSFNVVHGG